MAIDREAIWAALLQRLKDKLGASFVSYGRKHRMPPELGPELQPALFLVQVTEHRDPKPHGTAGKVSLNGLIIIYAIDNQPDEPIGQETTLMAKTMNGYIAAIEDAVAPDDAYDNQTLGGLVYECEIDGESTFDFGILGNQAMAMIPVRITVP